MIWIIGLAVVIIAIELYRWLRSDGNGHKSGEFEASSILKGVTSQKLNIDEVAARDEAAIKQMDKKELESEINK